MSATALELYFQKQYTMNLPSPDSVSITVFLRLWVPSRLHRLAPARMTFMIHLQAIVAGPGLQLLPMHYPRTYRLLRVTKMYHHSPVLLPSK